MVDNTLFALCVIGGKRAVVKMANRAPQIISGDIDRELQELTTVSDANGALCFAGGLNAYILNFPTENATWVYDIKESIWTKWGEWSSGSATYNAFPIVASCYAKAWNKHLFIGTDGIVYQFSRDVYQDAGEEIRTLIRTGWINHGTSRRKRCKQLYVKVKAYRPADTTLLMRWRDDGRPEWSPYLNLPLEATSEQTHYAKLNRFGIYRSRQYEFVLTDNSDLALMGLLEEIEELRN